MAVTVPHQTVKDTLISAFEGGSNYWYFDLARLKKAKTPYISEDCADGGFTLKSCEHDDKEYKVTPADYEKALGIMASKHPVHYANMINENGDAETGDVLLQILCFGNVELG